MNLVELQKDLEIASIDRGIDNYYKNIAGRKPAELTPERRYIAKGMDTMVPAIEAAQERWLSGLPIQGGSVWGGYLCGMDPKKLALTTLSTVYNLSDEDITYTNAAANLGKAIDQLRYFETIREVDNQYFHKVLAHSKKMTEGRFNLMKKNFKHPIKPMPHRDKIAVGARMLEFAIEHTDMFDYLRVIDRNKYKYIVRIKPEIKEEIMRMKEDHSLLLPEYLPMIVPPLPWTTQNDGGYYLLKFPIVKDSVGLDNGWLQKQREGRLSPLMNTINIVQAVPWAIDRDNLDLLDHMFRSGGDRAGLPGTERKRKPALPPDFETSKEARKLWLAEASKVNSHNATLAGRTLLVSLQLDTAKSTLDTMESYGIDGVYYPWDACFRYRLYPKHASLSVQSSDTGRGLLKFARGVKLGEHGYKWLSIGLANAIGEDKISFDDRYQYVHDHEKDIRRWVEDPYQNTGWCDNDCPFESLVIAREWVEAQQDKEGYVSHAPVSLDGTCNGLQHFAALARDRAAAKYTNLSPSDKPQSLYLVILDAVNEIIEDDCRETPKFDEENVMNPCFAWRGRVDKSVVKTPIMTTPYGVTSFGIMDQIHEAIRDTELEGHAGRNVRYMMNCIKTSMNEVMMSSSEIMDWLRHVAGICIRKGVDIQWTSPNGMPVFQSYPNFAQSRIYTAFHCITWRNPERINKEKPMSVHKNTNSIAPNFVHNLDATHMMMAVQEAYGVGIEDFRLIHDSYGVHAGNCEAFHPIINKTFHDLHAMPIMENFKRDIEERLGDELPPLPDKGDWDIRECLESPYMFN